MADDNRDAALSLAMMLRIMGHDTRLANVGVEALEVAAEVKRRSRYSTSECPN